MKIFSVLATMGLFCGLGQTADLLLGYLIHDDATTDTCFNNNAGSPEMVPFTADTFAECTVVKVSGSLADGFIIEDASDATKQLTYAATGDGEPATLTGTGTALKFMDGGDERSTVQAVTDSTVWIDVKAGQNTGQDCVTADLTYRDTSANGACNSDRFQFQLVCPENQRLNAAKTCDVMQGYLIFDADTPTCFKTNTAPGMVAYATIGDCTLVKVTGYFSLGYIIDVFGEANKQITFADSNEGTEATFSSAGTPLKFVLNEAELTTATALIDSSNAFVIDQYTGSSTGDECVTGTLAYTVTTDSTTCDDKHFYFMPAACDDASCKSCFPDAATCLECDDNKALKTDQTACLACSDIENCTACSADDQDEIQCSACEGTMILTSNACRACGDNEVPNEARTACDACEDNEVPNEAGTACDVCPDGESPNDAGTECEAPETTTGSGEMIMASTMLIIMVTVAGKQIWG